MKACFALLIFVLSSPLASAGPLQKVRERLETMDLQVDPEIVDVDFGDFAGIGLEVGLAVTANEGGSTYSRAERVKLNTKLGASAGGRIQIGTSMGVGTEIEFVRPFPSQLAALNLLANPPYTPANLPTTAAKALALKPGEYARFKMEMALALPAQMAIPLEITEVKGAVSYIILGDFQVEVYRKSGTQVLLRLSHLKKAGPQFNGRLSFAHPFGVFAVVGIEPPDENLITKTLVNLIVPSKLVDAEVANSKGKLFTLEYEFNLEPPAPWSAIPFLGTEEPAVNRAFEAIVGPKNWEVRTLTNVLASGRRDVEGLETIIVNVDEAEALTRAPSPHVKRIARSKTSFTEQKMGLNIDLKLLGRSSDTRYLVQDFTFVPEQGQPQSYRLAQLLRDRSFRTIRDWYSIEVRREANVLFDLSPEGYMTSFRELGFLFYRSSTRSLGNQLGILKQKIYAMMPEALHPQLNLDAIPAAYLTRKGEAEVEVLLHDKALGVLAGLSKSETDAIVDGFVRALAAHQNPGNRKYGVVTIQAGGQFGQSKDLFVRSTQSREQVKRNLFQIFNPASGSPVAKRWEELAKLRHNQLFDQVGPGIFSRLVYYGCRKDPTCKFEDIVTYRFRTQTEDGNSFTSVIGDYSRGESFKALLRARDRILERDFDANHFQ